MSLQATTSQTVGPFFVIGFEWMVVDNLAGPGVSGERVTIEGRVLDGDGQPVPDGVIELWQANAHGKYAHPDDTQDKPIEKGFLGFGRVFTDDNGKFSFTTIKPGPVPGPNGKMQDTLLTDSDGPYIELMVGAYSDNQPDYTWLQPYEGRAWTQYWYPFRDIDGVKNANTDAAARNCDRNRVDCRLDLLGRGRGQRDRAGGDVRARRVDDARARRVRLDLRR